MRVSQFTAILISSAVVGLLGGCNSDGGGDSTTPPTVSTSSFPVLNAWANYLQNSSSSQFTVSGSVFVGDAVAAVSGSGTATFGNLTTSSFEGRTAFAKTVITNGSVTATVNGQSQTLPVSSTSTGYYDSNYNPLGFVGDSSYKVVNGTATIPATAKVNDTGVIYTATIYNSNKSSQTGTQAVSWALEPEAADSAILVLLETIKNSSNVITTESISKYRITTTGVLTRISETAINKGTSATATLTFTYQ